MQDDFGSGSYILKDGQISPNKRWKCVYAGYGEVGVHNMYKPTNGRSGSCLYMRPQVNNQFTSSCLLLSEQSFGDFDTTFYLRTIEQTKTAPNNWETAWFMFRYTDSTHHYYMYIGKNGTIEVGKKDYELVEGGIKTPDGKIVIGGQDQQVFLNTDAKVDLFEFKKWYKVRLYVNGKRIKIWVDGAEKVDIVDDGKTGNWLGKPITFTPSVKMSRGKIGPYVEDAYMELDNITCI